MIFTLCAIAIITLLLLGLVFFCLAVLAGIWVGESRSETSIFDEE